jgi:pimeloyl-ACP methyl ester carboxylesterase
MKKNLPVLVPKPSASVNPLARMATRGFGKVVDFTVLSVMMTSDRLPEEHEVTRVRDEVTAANRRHRTLGYDDLIQFPNPPTAPKTMMDTRKWHPRVPYRHLTFPSDYEPQGEGRSRWLGYEKNRNVHAWVLQHQDSKPRPWLLCLHGLGMGTPWIDFSAFNARKLHREYGLNLLLPVLPLHGPRRSPEMMRGSMMSFELVDTMHAMAQAAWDIRRLLAWVRQQNNVSEVGMYGMSIGAYVSGLVASMEPVDLLVAGIPVADIPSLYARHTPPELATRGDGLGPFDERVQEMFRRVSPLTSPPQTPVSRRFIYAGAGDRVTPPDQAQRLWEAWSKPKMLWFDGGHASFFMSRAVTNFVLTLLDDTGFRA